MTTRKKTRKNAPKKAKPKCDRCRHYDCDDEKDCFGIAAEFSERYKKDGDLHPIARAAARVEALHYGAATRLEEIAHFAEEAGFQHLGVAYCKGFKEEAAIACELLRSRFKVSSVCCKVGAIPKKPAGFPNVRAEEKENMCNPAGQAEILNRAGTELNLILGLCVGHDALFSKHSRALVTTFVVKDRVLAHNPVGALYCPYVKRRLSEGYFSPEKGNSKK
jgi:uncharacterized metal-binding protein